MGFSIRSTKRPPRSPPHPPPDLVDKKADLHLHTTFSDGTLSPAELVQQAVDAGLAVIAVTDHDCVDGVAPARAAAAGRIEVLSGVEMTVAFRGVELHVLGLLIDIESPAITERLTQFRRARTHRLQDMIDRLKTYDVTVTLEEVLALSDHGAPGRPHLARALVQRGFVKTPEEAFDRFLGDQAPCFVKGATMTPAGAAALIRDAGGISSLAHPARFVPDEWLPELLAAGIQGIEAYHPDHSAATAKRYQQYAEQHGLLVTGGSDAHGTWKAHGPAVGSVTVPYAYVERLKAAAGESRGA